MVEFKARGDGVDRGSEEEGSIGNAEADPTKLREVGIGGDGAGCGGGEKTRRASDADAPVRRRGRSSAAAAAGEARRNVGWGRWYGLRELEIATRGFAEENVVGEGGYGVVYGGVLTDGSAVAVKNLLNKKGQAEKEFKVEVEAIGKVRHKNLVGLVGYCAEGSKRMLVYEYIDNGNLEQWLHGDVGPVSLLTWDIRMKIAVGTAKGLAYLHEGLEPKVVHRDIKSSNILLDKGWNPKISDFGLAKLLGSEASHVTTRVMGTFGYVSPEYASTGMLNEWSDVYSFGVLLMEIVTGRTPIDYSRPAAEMSLVDWVKGMVASHRGEDLVDPLIAVQPPPRALKRVLLVCLRCIDLDATKRPKMGQIVHMLETDDFPFRAEHRPSQERDPLPSRGVASHDINLNRSRQR
ncbi:probable receptor-like serine/threonine-protein kinase At4g34500 [Syzygium oleosum]|uniref:probable receptor-like serine/threonine-protein kinase At4g34500 n=1 Tax=Syzygium oleosum TaxID=219896 RepID=UPI0024B8E923|nr:probable receptor-like serine/threonine-protein kinase At4g34500 [Syzygium oleosum]